MKFSLILVAFVLLPFGYAVQADDTLDLERISDAAPRNVVLMLVDDHRYDAMGFMGHPFLETPNMDCLAAGGVHFTAGYVTTSLCSPSRASILTGQYAHNHRVVDNNNLAGEELVFFPEYLQAAGYQTGFFGKWHMGGSSDAPQPGFDRWVSFRGQGTYQPNQNGLNVDGERVPQQGYITDEITDYCVDWMQALDSDRPFFAYVSHKAVHAEFLPAERHQGRYEDAEWTPPETMALTEENLAGKPRWARDQRNSWHGVDFPYHSTLDVEQYYKRYCETLLAVDESLGRIMQTLEEKGVLEDTLIIYMGDNGFCFGEHGLIDKRTAYEASMRIPFLAYCPSLFAGGQVIDQVVANIDVAPTILHAAGLATPPQMDGRSFLDVCRGTEENWRDALLYEYYWERNFPQTPTMFALRTHDYKYIYYFGIWDTDELYDMRNDPLERVNLINSPDHQQIVRDMGAQLFAELERTGGMYIPLYPNRGNSQNLRNPEGSPPADFPPWFYRED